MKKTFAFLIAFIVILLCPACATPDNTTEQPATLDGTFTLKGSEIDAALVTMYSVAFHQDGTAALQQPPISSSIIGLHQTYEISGDSLMVYDHLYGGDDEEVRAAENHRFIAEFRIEDDGDTLVLVTAENGLYATVGAVYVRSDPIYTDEYRPFRGDQL